MKKLKPCPFCGGEAEAVEKYNNRGIYIQCKKCLNRTFAYGTRRTAVQHWNRRMKEE